VESWKQIVITRQGCSVHCVFLQVRERGLAQALLVIAADCLLVDDYMTL